MKQQTNHLLRNDLLQLLVSGNKNYRRTDMKAIIRSLLIALYCIIPLLLGCTPTTSIQVYENPKAGISLEKPDNWNVSYVERDGVLLLWTKKDQRNSDSARIEIDGANCPPDSTNSGQLNSTTSEFFVQDIKRITMLYNQALVVTVQEPFTIENSSKMIMKATIKIPTIAMKDDLNRIQVGQPEPDIFQTVDIFTISQEKYVFIAHFYEGNNASLNDQAQKIIFSIEGNCPAN